MRAYHAALLNRRLGSQDLRLEEVGARAAEAEELTSIGRVDEAISRLTDVVEHPKFELFEQTDEGRAALFRLGDALAQAGVYEPARAYFRRILAAPKAWQGNATYARRAVRRLVDVALESENFSAGADDLKDVASSATVPDETRGEVAYMTGRADEAKGDPDAALAAYAQVTQRSRFWAQATYLQGLIQVEKGRLKEGENLFCRVADPNRQSRTTPVFADEHYFAVRDLARLALGRIAHEQGRNDDARYYYYLVPRDSDRLAQALYEAATTRYEKKDYDGARELLDELKGLGIHHPYEDEAWVLDAYIDLARCKFEDADKKLVTFVALYEPVRDGARRVAQDDRAMEQLLRAARTGSDAGGAEVGGANVSPEAMRAIAALVRIDPNYGTIVKRRAVLEHEASGLRQSRGEINDLQRELATNGGVRPATEDEADPAARAADARAALDGIKRQLDDLDAAHASPEQVAAMREEASRLEAQLGHGAAASGEALSGAGAASGGDLPDLLANDARTGASLSLDVEKARQELASSEAALARDALKRVDLRLSRLLRRARLGRIESVLGRKRALEVEIEAINNGYLPQGAFDSLDAARFLQDNEEYWPFEGDDWPDEYVGSENPK
jgi:tetratricopeptide (TPR) repeat protein